MNKRRTGLLALAVLNLVAGAAVLALGSMAFGHAYAANVARVAREHPEWTRDSPEFADLCDRVLRSLSGLSDIHLAASAVLGANALAFGVLAYRRGRTVPGVDAQTNPRG